MTSCYRPRFGPVAACPHVSVNFARHLAPAQDLCVHDLSANRRVLVRRLNKSASSERVQVVLNPHTLDVVPRRSDRNILLELVELLSGRKPFETQPEILPFTIVDRSLDLFWIEIHVLSFPALA